MKIFYPKKLRCSYNRWEINRGAPWFSKQTHNDISIAHMIAPAGWSEPFPNA
jgi:hypothetical protein